MIKIDYSQYSHDELEDVWQQIDDRNYPERAVSIYLAMKDKNIARFDNEPSSSTFENELLVQLLYSRNNSQDEEYQFQQRKLAEKEKRVMAIISKK